jgi:hypothetical protein
MVLRRQIAKNIGKQKGALSETICLQVGSFQSLHHFKSTHPTHPIRPTQQLDMNAAASLFKRLCSSRGSTLPKVMMMNCRASSSTPSSSSMDSFSPSSPKVYTAYATGVVTEREGRKGSGNEFVIAGYGVHWKDDEFPDQCGRFASWPVTLLRAQMEAIIKALDTVCFVSHPMVLRIFFALSISGG